MRYCGLAATIACLGLGLTGANADDRTGDRMADRKAIAKAKVETWRAFYRDQDVAGLGNFLMDEFVVIGPDGAVRTKTEELAWLAENEWGGADDFLYSVDDIIFVSETVALVYGRGNSTRLTDEGAQCRHTYRSSNTLVKAGDRWRPVLSHVSGVRCDPME